MIERLESRALLSVFLDPGNGGLVVGGTEVADVVRVSREGKYVVVRGHESYRGRFRAADVKGLLIFAGAGNDVVRAQVDQLQVYVFGNTGDDTITGGEGDDVLRGDEGNDVLRGRGGDDRLEGGSNRDLLMGGAGNDTMIDVRRNDVVRGGAGHDDVQRRVIGKARALAPLVFGSREGEDADGAESVLV